MRERIAILSGIRTPMGKAGGVFDSMTATDLGVAVTKEILALSRIRAKEIDEVIFGNVAQPADSANIARVIALESGIPVSVPASTVHRNCASGMESITTAADRINAGQSRIILAGGVESMSNIPLLFAKGMSTYLSRVARAKTLRDKIVSFSGFRPSLLKPEIGLVKGLTDPVSGMIMGLTAEVLAGEFRITREEQDEYALRSHSLAVEATDNGVFADEIVPVPLSPDYDKVVSTDEGPRRNQTLAALAKLAPYFDSRNGTVTVGNSCPVTDGAAAVILVSETLARERGFTPLGFLRDYAYAALEPERMGLGPVYATAKLLDKTGVAMKDIELVEMNEAFAAQIIANERAFPSREFAARYLGRERAVGELDRSILNVNGGAIALGHPVGMTGTRLVIHLLKEMRRRKNRLGLATLCVGGGQGAALLLEAE